MNVGRRDVKDFLFFLRGSVERQSSERDMCMRECVRVHYFKMMESINEPMFSDAEMQRRYAFGRYDYIPRWFPRIVFEAIDGIDAMTGDDPTRYRDMSENDIWALFIDSMSDDEWRAFLKRSEHPS